MIPINPEAIGDPSQTPVVYLGVEAGKALGIENRTSPTFLSFDGMAWPNPEDPRSVEWRLRYGEPTREDLMVAASFIGAYKQLVEDSVARRNAKVAGIRRAMRRTAAAIARSHSTQPTEEETTNG